MGTVNSITLHQNQGTSPAWNNPNVWPGDANGNPITPKDGQVAHLWAKVMNDGTAVATSVNVSFYLCNPSGGLVWPAAAHGSGSVASIAVGNEQNIMCSVPWIPNSSTGSHKCIVAVASCLDCAAPPTTPGTHINANNKQIGQHNITIHTVTTSEKKVSRSFSVQAPKGPGYIEITREPIGKNTAALKRRGIHHATKEAPADETIKLENLTTGEIHGNRIHFKAGENHDFLAHFEANSIKPGTAAYYHIRHYENGKLVGGVSHLVQH